jgi:hypothetical protein
MRRIRRAFVFLFLCSSIVSNVFSNWGIEVGRANEGDNARLLQDWIKYKMALNRLDKSMTKSTLAERQKEALGNPREIKNQAELLDDVYDWWLENVMGPARDIASNPAASCAEAENLTISLLKMMRARQILGFNTTDPRDLALDNMLPDTMAMMFNRCRDEALDECVATGRFRQIVQLALAEDRQSQIRAGIGVADVYAWAEDALKQCVIYELHFVSTTNVEMPIVETVRDGKVAIRVEPSDSFLETIIGGKMREVIKGETKGGNNPFFVSVKCALPGNFEVTCSPGADSKPIMSRIQYLDMKHKKFYVDEKGFPRVSKAEFGEDKFAFEFAGGDFALEAVVKGPVSSHNVPLASVGPAFYIAHRKDALGKGPEHGVKIEHIKRGAYPVLFEFTYADENAITGVTITDSTEFQLIHKPEKKPYPTRPEPIRKPLKPKPGGGE